MKASLYISRQALWLSHFAFVFWLINLSFLLPFPWASVELNSSCQLPVLMIMICLFLLKHLIPCTIQYILFCWYTVYPRSQLVEVLTAAWPPGLCVFHLPVTAFSWAAGEVTHFKVPSQHLCWWITPRTYCHRLGSPDADPEKELSGCSWDQHLWKEAELRIGKGWIFVVRGEL